MAAIAWQHDLAQASPVAALGTLRWQVSKMAFDAAKVMTIFYVKNLGMAAWHPARYGQLRAPLVEQRVPSDVEAAMAVVASACSDHPAPTLAFPAASAAAEPNDDASRSPEPVEKGEDKVLAKAPAIA